MINSENLSNMFEKLADPELITQFQRSCGLIWKGGKNGASNGVKSDVLNKLKNVNKVVCNGSAVNAGNETKQYEYIPHVHLLFHLSSALGDEQVLIAILSFMYWNLDPKVIMRVFLSLAISLYIGQFAKDVVMAPRPPSPPVIRVEKKYAEEYSMPSSHAMMGVVIPFSLVYFTHEKYEYDIVAALIAASICCCLVGASRVYLGMHSVKDVLAGIILECAIICIILPCMKELAMEKWCQTSQNALYTAFILPSMLLLIYPTSTPITFNTYADTAMVLGIFAGSVVGLRFSAENENLMLEFLTRTSGMSGYELYGLYMLRFAVGTIILALTRATMKWCVTSSFSKIVPSFMITKPLGYKRFVEIPHKIITYGMVAFNCIYITPKVFKLGGI